MKWLPIGSNGFMLGEILGCKAGLEETLPRLRLFRAGSFLVIAPGFIGSSGEVCREIPLDGFNEGVNDGVLLLERFKVGVGISSPYCLPFILVAVDESGASTSRFKYSEVSIDIGGISSVGKLVFGSLISEAGVTGAFNGL